MINYVCTITDFLKETDILAPEHKGIIYMYQVVKYKSYEIVPRTFNYLKGITHGPFHSNSRFSCTPSPGQLEWHRT